MFHAGKSYTGKGNYSSAFKVLITIDTAEEDLTLEVLWFNKDLGVEIGQQTIKIKREHFERYEETDFLKPLLADFLKCA